MWKEGGERDTRGETCLAFCVPFSLSLFSSLPTNMGASLGGERHPFRHVEVVICCRRPPPVSFSFPISCDLLALSLPPSPCHLRSLSMCTRPSRRNKTMQVCTFAASLFLLRWSKSALCATERGFNSCAFLLLFIINVAYQIITINSFQIM